MKLENVRNHDLLQSALAAEFGAANVRRVGESFRVNVGGYMVTIDRGRATSTMGGAALGAVVGRVKQAYSRKAVELAAKRFGWATVKGADANHFALRKG